MRILAIDPDRGFADSLADIGRILGIVVIPAATGREAADRALRGRFDFCLVRPRLPDMTGVQVCNRIRTALRSARATVPGFALVTDSADFQSAMQARHSGIAVLSSPVKFLQLLELMQTARPHAARSRQTTPDNPRALRNRLQPAFGTT